jgi:hypothetical protein
MDLERGPARGSGWTCRDVMYYRRCLLARMTRKHLRGPARGFGLDLFVMQVSPDAPVTSPDKKALRGSTRGFPFVYCVGHIA